ncbi:MAG: hypothetical protein NVS3B7_06910 [Candidatus Elarobacter sp.]
MHDDKRPADPAPKNRKGGVGAAGGILVAGIAFWTKIKVLLLALAGAKWLLLAPKLLLSFGSIFVSIWFYALFYGWKFGFVFVLLIVVHELGHYLTFRNFGVRASLPTLIPGLGAFVSAPLQDDPARNAIAAIMGPVFGILASAVCWGYGLALHESFWIAAAYVGFLLNLLNLIPAYPLDGGRVAGAIDGRLWLIGVVLIVGWIVVSRSISMFTILIAIFVLVSSVPRAIAAFKGIVDPRERIATGPQRAAMAFAYFALLAVAAAGAAATHLTNPGTLQT